MEDLYVATFWGPRSESVEQCADRLILFFRDLSTGDDVFSTCYAQGESRRDAMRKRFAFANRASVTKLLERGRNKRDIDKGVMPKLGYRVGVWKCGESTMTLRVWRIL